ncbi:gustatory receptor 23a-like [Venturia canescens]|uniref:gustatory receptor 23a-like n=1 Tax=Venturia canescens TaxID=32260 RepID=UPI001C9BC1AD|nr:gustatory receptor 23a-like [Venturia canescens]XP_043288357.1 gustatory receptor 23a-like [Venturia canescens]XP_043288358.1 gustatory receptor 23a-like [Venturia canescens]
MGVSGAFGGAVKPLKKWRLFKATDYVSLMYPCFELLRIYGFFPYKITSGSTMVSSKLGYIYSTLLTGLNFGLMCFLLYQMDVSHKLQYASVPGYLQGNCYVVLGCSIAFVSYVYSSKRMRLLCDLAELSARLPSSSFTQVTKIVHAKDILGFFFLVAQYGNIYSEEATVIVSKILAMYITVVVYLVDTLYVDSVIVLRVCFERVNDNLIALKDSICTEDPHLLRRVYHKQKNPLLLLEIRAMKKQHNDISEVVQRLNSTFSLQIVATVTLTFAEITFSLYFYILQTVGFQSIDLKTQIWFCYFITSVTYYSVKMASIVWACETAKAQAIKTGIIVHEALIGTTDKQVKEELQLFSLQLLHRDNSFQAKGLSLDATLITAIVGGIATYLLILIQFLVAGKTSNPDSQTTPIPIMTSTPGD